MVSEIVSLISGLGLGGLLGIFAKSLLDKQQMRFTKVFDFKEVGYKAMSILMLIAADESSYAWDQLRTHRPRINKREDLDDELRSTGSASWCYAAECGDEYASA